MAKELSYSSSVVSASGFGDQAGRVDQDVPVAEPPDGGIDQLGDLIDVGQVPLVGHCLDSVCLEFGDSLAASSALRTLL